MLNNIIKAISGKGLKSNNEPTGFSDTLTVEDLVDSATVALVADKAMTVGEFVILPQTERKLGFQNAEFQSNQGTIFMLLKDNTGEPVELDDKTQVRLQIIDSNGRVKGVSLSERYGNLKTGSTNLTERFKFPESGVKGLPYDKVSLVLTVPADITLSKANSTIMVSSTQYWTGS